MQLDDGRARFRTGLDLRGVGVDEQRHADAVRSKRSARVGDAALLAGHVEAAFGRELLAPFRHQAAVGRPVLGRELDHRVRHGHFEIQPRLHRAQQDVDVARLNVPAVLTQVHRDAVRARLLGDQSRRHGIGITRVTRLA